jgi:hypothetical protein
MNRRRKTPNINRLALDAATIWSKQDLEFFRGVIDTLLEPPPSIELPKGCRGGGYYECKVIKNRNYFYYRYNHEGKRRSIYVGKQFNEPPAGFEGLAAIHRRNF